MTSTGVVGQHGGMDRHQLTRSETNRRIAGVCGGIAEYFDIDPIFVRVAFIAAAFGNLATSTAAGTTYDIRLEAFDHTHLVAMVHDSVLLV